MVKNKCRAASFSIVAHSAGGRSVARLFKDYQAEFMKKVKCLVFTDAYYHSMLQGLHSRTTNTLKSFSIHFRSHKAGEY